MKDYTYNTFTVDGREFSITDYKDELKVYIKSIHPYDDADYHWALNRNGGDFYTIYIGSPGKKVDTVFGSKEKVARKLLELDKNIEPRMSYESKRKAKIKESVKTQILYYVTKDGEPVSPNFLTKMGAKMWAEDNYPIDDDSISIEQYEEVYETDDFNESNLLKRVKKLLNESEKQIYNIEYNYGDGSPGLAIGHVKVKANSEEEALEKAEKYASNKYYRDDSYYIEDSCKIVKSGYSNDPIIESSQKNEDYDDDDDDYEEQEEMHKERYAVYFETQEGGQKYTIYHVYTDSTDDSYNELCDKRDNQLGMYSSYKELKDALKEKAEKIAAKQGWTVKSIENLGEDDSYYRERNKWESVNEEERTLSKSEMIKALKSLGYFKSKTEEDLNKYYTEEEIKKEFNKMYNKQFGFLFKK